MQSEATTTVVELDNLEADVYSPPQVTELDLEVNRESQVLLTALAKIGSVQDEEDSSDALYYGLLEGRRYSECEGYFNRCSCSCNADCCVPVVDLEPSLVKTQAIGRELLKQEVFPLFSTNGREVWSYVQFLLVLGFVLKCAIIDIAVNSPSKRTPVDFASLAFSLAFLLFSIVDICITIYQHRCHLVCTLCHRHRATNNDESSDNSPSTKRKHCRSSCLQLKSIFEYVDLFRMILNEVIVYTITICTMLQLILNSKQDDNDLQLAFSIISFIIAVLWKIGTVYSICVFVVVRTILNLKKIRKDGPVASSANWCHIHLIIHVLAQMVSQVSMIVCIGAKIHYENRNFSVENNVVQISGFLWYMFFGALIIPLVGVFTFGISNFYSVQEYPIGYFLDLLDAVIKRSKEQGARSTVETEFSSEKNKKIVQYIKLDFKYFNDRFPCIKYFYVVLSPLLATLSIIHALLIGGFLASCLHGVRYWCHLPVRLFNRLDDILCDDSFSLVCC